MSLSIAQQYESWPYPDIPLWASLRGLDVWQLHLEQLRSQCGLPLASGTPRIWIAGCGTFQPYVFATANPGARILATDLSQASLRRAWQRCRMWGHFGVQFDRVDLNQPASWPEGPFDLIECYGVLMNLKDPQAALTELAKRLSPNGILRVMVYPWYSRRRVFQVQRVGRLLGFSSANPRHPRQLRELMLGLPKGHPLRFAVSSYADAQNDAGMVDGFLHGGDRGFTAAHLGTMALEAGLTAGWWVHRPWSQPDRVARRLGLGNATQTEVLDHLDRWQELRTNLTVCLIRNQRSPALEPVSAGRLHPVIAGREGRSRLRALFGRLRGLVLPSKTAEEDVRYSGRELRLLAGENPPPALLNRALRDGIWLGPREPEARLPFHRPGGVLEPVRRIELGEQVANPLYDHLFAPFREIFAAIEAELESWRGFADPLEEPGKFGLTPLGSWEVAGPWLEGWWERNRERPAPSVLGYEQVRYSGEKSGFSQVWSEIRAHSPRQEFSEAEQRELWVLLGSYQDLLLDSEPA